MKTLASLPERVQDSRLETRFQPNASQPQVIVHVKSNARRAVPTQEVWMRERVLGQGGYGTVWLERIHHKSSQATPDLRAVKQIRVLKANDRYVRELDALTKFSHEKFSDSFVEFYGWFESPEPEWLFIAMEYCEKGDLRTYLQSRGRLPEDEGQEVAIQVLHGLRYMHENQFAHRDLKPENLLIKSQPPEEWWIKICDLGLSKRAQDAGVLTVKGTPGFIPPEYSDLSGDPKAVDSYAADMWCLGETISYILTCQHLFNHVTLIDYCRDHLAFPVETLKRSSVSESCIDFLKQTMAADPRKRLTSVAATSHSWVDRAAAFEPEIAISEFNGLVEVGLGVKFTEEHLAQPSGAWTHTMDGTSPAGGSTIMPVASGSQTQIVQVRPEILQEDDRENRPANTGLESIRAEDLEAQGQSQFEDDSESANNLEEKGDQDAQEQEFPGRFRTSQDVMDICMSPPAKDSALSIKEKLMRATNANDEPAQHSKKIRNSDRAVVAVPQEFKTIERQRGHDVRSSPLTEENLRELRGLKNFHKLHTGMSEDVLAILVTDELEQKELKEARQDAIMRVMIKEKMLDFLGSWGVLDGPRQERLGKEQEEFQRLQEAHEWLSDRDDTLTIELAELRGPRLRAAKEAEQQIIHEHQSRLASEISTRRRQMAAAGVRKEFRLSPRGSSPARLRRGTEAEIQGEVLRSSRGHSPPQITPQPNDYDLNPQGAYSDPPRLRLCRQSSRETTNRRLIEEHIARLERQMQEIKTLPSSSQKYAEPAEVPRAYKAPREQGSPADATHVSRSTSYRYADDDPGANIMTSGSEEEAATAAKKKEKRTKRIYRLKYFGEDCIPVHR